MNFAWLMVMLFALIGVVCGQSCPPKFKLEDKLCVTDRPIRGECPPGSQYSANNNKCVYVARS